MNPSNYNLEQVGKAFDNWRASRQANSPIPKELWALVDNIYHHYPRGNICSRLGVSSAQLKRRGHDVKINEAKIINNNDSTSTVSRGPLPKPMAAALALFAVLASCCQPIPISKQEIILCIQL